MSNKKPLHRQVMFINEATREYQFYNIIATVTASEIVDTLVFTSRAREIMQKDLVIANPLSSDVEFQIRCDKLNCPNAIFIGRNSEVGGLPPNYHFIYLNTS